MTVLHIFGWFFCGACLLPFSAFVFDIVLLSCALSLGLLSCSLAFSLVLFIRALSFESINFGSKSLGFGFKG